MNEEVYTYENLIKPNIKISFETNYGKSIEYSLPIEGTWVRSLRLGVDLILVLSFLPKDNGSVLIRKDFLQISKHTLFTPIYLHNEKTEINILGRQIREKECNCKNERECQLVNEEISEEINEEDGIELNLDPRKKIS